jgi:hypothetical protein
VRTEGEGQVVRLVRAADVQDVGPVEDGLVAVRRTHDDDRGLPGLELDVVQPEVLLHDAGQVVVRRVVADQLLDGSADQARVVDEEVPLVAVPLQGGEPVAQQVGRRLTAAEEDEQVHRDELVLGHRLVVAVVEEQPGQLGSLTGGPEVVDHLADVGPERVDGLVGLAQARVVETEQPADRLGPLPDHVPVGLRDPDEVDDDADRQLVGQVLLTSGCGFSSIAATRSSTWPWIESRSISMRRAVNARDEMRRSRACPVASCRLMKLPSKSRTLKKISCCAAWQPAHRPLGQLAEPVGVLPDRVCAAHHRLDVGVVRDEGGRALPATGRRRNPHATARTSGTARRWSRGRRRRTR